jgi:hypothetical protein
MKEETLEDFIKDVLQDEFFTNIAEHKKAERLIQIGANWQAEQDKNKFNEEDILINIELSMIQGLTLGEYRDLLIEQFKKK